MGRLAFAGVSVALAACGAGHPGVVIGSVGGQIFRVVDGTAAIRMSSGETFARIQLGDRPSLCDLESRYTVTQSAHTLIIDLADFSANRDNYQAPSAPGRTRPRRLQAARSTTTPHSSRPARRTPIALTSRGSPLAPRAAPSR